jgi:hypothetical protein
MRIFWCAACCAMVLSIQAGAQANDPLRPEVVRYGASLEQTQAALAGVCRTIDVRRISPPARVLRTHVKREQLQLDCDGFPYRGAPRWAEFVFADDSLEIVWIMTRAEDEQPLLAALRGEYGDPTHHNDQFVAFLDAGAALRLDVPEVLFYSPKLAQQVAGWFAKQSTFN